MPTPVELRSVFSVLGLPIEIVSDNGPPFDSYEFQAFCDANGIRLTHSPPYHPQSNGEGEVAVRVAKQTLKKLVIDCKTKKLNIEHNLSNFLLKYRITPTACTGKSPSNMIFNYNPRSLFDVLNGKGCARVRDQVSNGISADQPRLQKYNVMENKQKEVTVYSPGEIVSYQIVWNSFVKWVPAKIIRKVSRSVYEILVNSTKKTAHVQQLKKTKAKDMLNWPGIFEHKQFENNNVTNVQVRHPRARKRLRSPVAVSEMRRSERLAKVARKNYKD